MVTFKRTNFQSWNRRKRKDFNPVETEIKKIIKNFSKEELKQKIEKVIKAYEYGKSLKWDIKREETKRKIIKYLISVFQDKENKALANALNRAYDIFTCVCWLDVAIL